MPLLDFSEIFRLLVLVAGKHPVLFFGISDPT